MIILGANNRPFLFLAERKNMRSNYNFKYNKKLSAKTFVKIISIIAVSSNIYSANDTVDTKKKIREHAGDIELTRTLSAVGTGPYFGIGSEYDGSDLVVLQPNIHKDLGLLRQQQRTAKYTGEFSGPKNPYVQLSGYIESQAVLESRAKNRINLTASNLDFSAWVNRYFSGYTNFGVETDDTSDQHFRMILGFVTLGNLNDSPFYMSAGQMFIPFGSFSTGTSAIGVIPRSLGRILEQAVSVGYYSENTGWHVTGALYDGKTKISTNKRVNQYAGTVSYTTPKSIELFSMPSTIKAGMSYTSNLADAAVTRAVFDRNPVLDHYIPGVDVFTKINWGQFVVRGEYVSAVDSFARTDILQGNQKIKPGSFLSEFEYDTRVYGKNTAFVLHYSRIFQGALASPIKRQIGVNATMNIFKDTIVSLEYARRFKYSENNALPIPTDTTFTNLSERTVRGLNSAFNGRNDGVVYATVDLFF